MVNQEIDKPKAKLASLIWLRDHDIEIDRFLKEQFDPDDYDFYYNFLTEFPEIGYQAVSDFFKPNPQKMSAVLDYINTGSKIILVLGARGQGKSCTVHYILREIERLYHRDIYMVGPPMDIDPHFHHSYDVFLTPEGSINVIDESALLANARQSKDESNISLVSILPTLRHVDKTVIVITQNSALTDLNFVRLADAVIVKQFSFLQAQTEREDLFGNQLLFFMPRRRGETFFYSDQFLTKFRHDKHPEWTTQLSKCYRYVKDEQEAIDYAISLHGQNTSIAKIQMLLKVKGFIKDTAYYEELLGTQKRK